MSEYNVFGESLPAQKKTFQSLDRSKYKCPQCKSLCQARKVPFEQQANSFLELGREIYILKHLQKSIEVIIGNVYLPGRY